MFMSSRITDEDFCIKVLKAYCLWSLLVIFIHPVFSWVSHKTVHWRIVQSHIALCGWAQMTLHRLSEWTLYVQMVFGTECSWRTKESLLLLKPPEAPGLNGCCLYTLILPLNSIFLVRTPHASMQLRMHKQNTQAAFTESTNTYTNWLLPSWQRLLSSGNAEGACCLFVSSSALFPLERYVTSGGEKEERKSTICWLLTPPTSIYHSIHFPSFLK